MKKIFRGLGQFALEASKTFAKGFALISIVLVFSGGIAWLGTNHKEILVGIAFAAGCFIVGLLIESEF